MRGRLSVFDGQVERAPAATQLFCYISNAAMASGFFVRDSIIISGPRGLPASGAIHAGDGEELALGPSAHNRLP